MSTNNKVFQVLVTKNNHAPAVAGTALSALLPGQIGLFDASSHLAINGVTPVKEFYIAVGVTADRMNFSAGQYIQKDNIRDYIFRPHTASAPQIFEITGYTANCDTDYTLRFEFRNMQIYYRQGTNQFSKAYSVRTACCGCGDECPSGSAVELTQKMFKALQADVSGMFKVEAIKSAGGAVIADIDAFAADPANVSATPGLRITVNGLEVNKFTNVNTKYYNPRQTVVIPSLVDGFNCTGKITVIQQAVGEEGNGTDIKQKEYHAGGWNGRPGIYRVSTVMGLAKDGFEYFADENVKYDQINLVYDHFSTAGWGEYLNNLLTLVAIPEPDTVTRNGFIGYLDAVLASRGFEPLADDAAIASTNPAVVERTLDKPIDKNGLSGK